MIDPAELSKQIVQEVISKGSTKDGCDETWRDKPQNYHLHKAVRHIMSFLLTGEIEHLKNALTRIAMALSQIHPSGSGSEAA